MMSAGGAAGSGGGEQAAGGASGAGTAGVGGSGGVDGAVSAQQASTLKLFQKLLKAEKIPGGSFAIAHTGKVAFTGATGVRHMGEPAKVETKTFFRLASVTKTFTSLMIHTLVDEGKLDRAARVVDVAPSFHATTGDDASAVTIEQLLTHTSGLGDFSRRDCTTSLAMFFERENPKELEVWSPAGRLWNYANPNYATLGYLAEKVAGKPYTELMQTRVLDPIGMHDTTFDSDFVAASENYVIGNVPVGGGEWVDGDDPAYDCPAAMPYGRLWSNADDMGIFAGELLAEAPHVLAPGTFGDMATGRVATGFGPDEKYGYGLFETKHKGLRVVSHDGDLEGISTTVWLLPEKDLAVVVLLNANASAATIAGRLADSLLGLPTGDEPELPLPDPALYPQYVGDYDAPHDMGRFRISTKEDKLLLQFLDNQGAPSKARELFPYTMETFVFDGSGQGDPLAGTFARDVNGNGTFFATRGGTGRRVGDSPVP
jgi:CubicO group peptidase (beta-lactamase class C family)